MFVNHYGSTEVYTFTVNPTWSPGPAPGGIHSAHARGAADPERPGQPQRRAAGRRGRRLIASPGLGRGVRGSTGNGPDADRARLRDGWYFTGDLGYRDADGDYWVTGRVDDMIVTAARTSTR